MKYQMIVEYDGTHYYGFQKQDDKRTIESEILRSFRLMTKNDILVFAASRTDKGVHAKGQSIHFETDFVVSPQVWVNGLNKRLPTDIRVRSVRRVASVFHARHSSKGKIYHYLLSKNKLNAFNSNHMVYIENFNVELVKPVLKDFVGMHDYIAFSKFVKDKPHVKEIFAVQVVERKDKYVFIFHGKSFLKYMVRSMMGTIIDIGLSKKDQDQIQRMLETKDRKLASKTADAKGLYLMKVIY